MTNAPEIFAAMAEAVGGPDGTKLRRKFKGSVVFTISDNNEQWYLDLKSEKPSAGKLTAGGAPTNPDLSVKVSESDMIKMVRKELNPQQAFMKGKLKIKGKMALAMKLTSVLAATSKHLPKSRL
uniref:SCP2 domain-containing protein n=1 Tax=Minutocellus polymorphus TaxID=265543 RepID=A0A6U0JTU3_9STRA|mmetsp:Transcript_20034/g.33128  ORF Transcript_20034/g.33128 Transcript_20034/m.33128 type:complete len:124 (+) Transcript_20034:25-396(+)